jgi:hypothetical protein
MKVLVVGKLCEKMVLEHDERFEVFMEMKIQVVIFHLVLHGVETQKPMT